MLKKSLCVILIAYFVQIMKDKLCTKFKEKYRVTKFLTKFSKVSALNGKLTMINIMPLLDDLSECQRRYVAVDTYYRNKSGVPFVYAE